MKANEFIKKYGLEKVRSIINKYPNYTHSTDDARMFVNEHDCIEHIKKDLHTCVRFDDLKHLIQSHDLVNDLGGLIVAKRIADQAKEDNFIYLYRNVEQAIADVESCQ